MWVVFLQLQTFVYSTFRNITFSKHLYLFPFTTICLLIIQVRIKVWEVLMVLLALGSFWFDSYWLLFLNERKVCEELIDYDLWEPLILCPSFFILKRLCFCLNLQNPFKSDSKTFSFTILVRFKIFAYRSIKDF